MNKAGSVEPMPYQNLLLFTLNDFIRNVDTGRGQRGLQSFLDAYLDSMITCGRAVGEIVTCGSRDIAAVLCGNVADVQIRGGIPLLILSFAA